MKASSALLLGSLCSLLLTAYAENHYVKFVQSSEAGTKTCTILSQEIRRHFRGYADDSPNSLLITSKPALSSPADSIIPNIKNTEMIFEIFGRDKNIIDAHLNLLCKSVRVLPPLKVKKGEKAPEVIKIIEGGSADNRIDVVFMGDGYNGTEREKFISDITRLTTEMFEGETFKSYLPVFNIWAIYVESVDSGIGYDGPLNTPFELYREAGQLRGIFPGNASYARQVCLLTGTGACDYPSIIGNDDFYGGLGGEFVISTKSERTGTVVLRHEMGHNFVNVGEEYDNGQVYRGVNSAISVPLLGWSHWLTEGRKEERAIYRLNEYPWQDLSTGSVEFTFTSDGAYSRWYLIVSVSAAGEEDSLEFMFDGEILPWETRGFDDREFYSWYGSQPLTQGQHTFNVRSKTPSTHPKIPRMICSINLHELGSEDEYHEDNTYVSAYPTWDVFGRKKFRPTADGCLMRNMTHASFCPVCKEGMWYQFLERISLIDDVSIERNNPDAPATVTVNTLKLGQLREPAQQIEGETLEISWSRNNVEVEEFRNFFTISAQDGNWKVTVKFVSPEIRRDPDDLTTDSLDFTI